MRRAAHLPVMTNAMKDRGDRTEREALAAVHEAMGRWLVANPMRQLGAGRKDDIGDLHVLADCTIQVKASRPSTLVATLRDAAMGAQTQSRNAGTPLSVGLVKLHAVRSGVVWVAVTTGWPVPVVPGQATAIPSTAVGWVRDERLKDEYRIVRVTGKAGAKPYLISTFEAWVAAYEQYQVAALQIPA